MREIKFRAWDKVNKRWIKHFNIDLLNINIFDLPNIEINQYTNVNDVNKKEIYDGDIVLDVHNKSPMVVLFRDGEWRIENKDYDEALYDLGIDKEVVGNIYENKDLLGDEE